MSLKPYHHWLIAHIPAQSRVLEIGCGGGELLAALRDQKQAHGHGIEIESARVAEAVRHGLSVVQGNAGEDMADYPAQRFDVAVLAYTLQVMDQPRDILEECLRVAKEVVVVIPNFGHLRNRWYLLRHGKMPVTNALSYQWYETPNIHFCTIRDMLALAQIVGARVAEWHYATVDKQGTEVIQRGDNFLRLHHANLCAEYGIFVLKKVGGV